MFLFETADRLVNAIAYSTFSLSPFYILLSSFLFPYLLLSVTISYSLFLNISCSLSLSLSLTYSCTFPLNLSIFISPSLLHSFFLLYLSPLSASPPVCFSSSSSSLSPSHYSLRLSYLSPLSSLQLFLFFTINCLHQAGHFLKNVQQTIFRIFFFFFLDKNF
jgi:hypothetical protein